MEKYAALVFGALALVTLILIAYALLRLFWWFGKTFLKLGFRHPSLPVQVVSLAITLTLFPSYVVAVATYLSNLLTNFFVQAPDALSGFTSRVALECQTTEAGACLLSMWNNYLYFLTSAFSTLSGRPLFADPLEKAELTLGSLTLTTVYVLAAWIMIGALLVLVSGIQPIGPGLAQIRSVAINIRTTTLKNICLFAILLLASYLSFASIAAIPSLEREDAPDSVKPENLNDVMLLDVEKVTKSVDSMTIGIETKELDSAIQLQKGATKIGLNESEFDAAKADAMIKNSGLIKLAETLRSRVNHMAVTLKEIANSTYTTVNLKRVGARATIDHYRSMHAWFLEEIEYLLDELSRCDSAIIAYQRAIPEAVTNKKVAHTPRIDAWRSPTSSSASEYVAQISPTASSQVDLTLPRPLASFGSAEPPDPLRDAFLTAQNACTFRYEPEDAPIRGDLKNYVGSFGVAISWLLSSESQPLVLIVGLLGFGLLGAACSTFVREVSVKGTDGGALVDDLAGVVIRGVSAAVVVFLAVYGGLAIFSSNADPNPYAVLFTCLVGAVFSEVVWKWAQDRLAGELSNKPPSGENGTKEDASKTDVITADAPKPGK
jgi:hypothetical protein